MTYIDKPKQHNLNLYDPQQLNCDKCRELVNFKNDAVLIEVAAYFPDRTHNLYYREKNQISRHFMPVIVDGVIRCFGSQSRNQYIEGQPKDPRGFYKYYAEEEEKWRTGYNILQEWNKDTEPLKSILGAMKEERYK